MIQFSNLIRARPSCVIALAFALQGAPAARAQAWSFFLECGKFPDKEQASQRMEALRFLGLPIFIRRDQDKSGNIWYELVIRGIRTPDEAQRKRILVEASGGPDCKSELVH
jgi:cell division protein FtsN